MQPAVVFLQLANKILSLILNWNNNNYYDSACARDLLPFLLFCYKIISYLRDMHTEVATVM